jgi:hypothetical protein
MIGRGCRRVDGKEQFRIVGFVDNLERHKEALATSERFFGGGVPRSRPREQRSRGPRLPRHRPYVR